MMTEVYLLLHRHLLLQRPRMNEAIRRAVVHSTHDAHACEAILFVYSARVLIALDSLTVVVVVHSVCCDHQAVAIEWADPMILQCYCCCDSLY